MKRGRVRGTQKTTVDGIKFDSKKEARRWGELQLMVKAGLITHLKRQVSIELIGMTDHIRTKTGKPMRYIADFAYVDAATGLLIYEDAKGYATDTFRMKRAILLAMGIEVKVV